MIRKKKKTLFISVLRQYRNETEEKAGHSQCGQTEYCLFCEDALWYISASQKIRLLSKVFFDSIQKVELLSILFSLLFELSALIMKVKVVESLKHFSLCVPDLEYIKCFLSFNSIFLSCTPSLKNNFKVEIC